MHVSINGHNDRALLRKKRGRALLRNWPSSQISLENTLLRVPQLLLSWVSVSLAHNSLTPSDVIHVPSLWSTLPPLSRWHHCQYPLSYICLLPFHQASLSPEFFVLLHFVLYLPVSIQIRILVFSFLSLPSFPPEHLSLVPFPSHIALLVLDTCGALATWHSLAYFDSIGPL